MKKILMLATAAALCACGGKNAYMIDGNVAGLEGTVYLLDAERTAVDSTAVTDGTFRFEGTVEEPAVRYLTDNTGFAPASFAAMLILEPGTISVADNAEGSSTKITGTPSNDAAAAYEAAAAALVTEYRNPETTDERRDAIEQEYEALTRTAATENRTNYFGAMILAQQLAYDLSGAELLDEIALFPEELQRTELLAELKERAEQKLKTDIGQPYIDVAQKDADGNVVTLASVIGNPAVKYTLLDFWASWCGPCMGEVPALKEAYAAYHDKGFEIFGVSLDNNKERWTAAIENNGMNWIHVSDLQGWQNAAAAEYGVRSIPANFLIDAEGKIVATGLRGDELKAKIAELLD